MYLPPKDGEKVKKYTRESTEIMKQAFALWARELRGYKNCVIFTDGGYAFKDEKKSVFDVLGALKHIVIPSMPQAFISTCDSGVNFPAKRMWRIVPINGEIRMDQEPLSSICLFYCFARCSPELIKAAWQRKFQISNKNPTVKQVQAAMQNDGCKNSDFHEEYMKLYDSFMQDNYVEYIVSTRKDRHRDTGLVADYEVVEPGSKRKRTKSN